MLHEEYLAGRLPDFFAAQAPTAAERKAGLEEGRFLIDERLVRYLDEQVGPLDETAAD